MAYTKPLPDMSKLTELAKTLKFPVTRRGVVRKAKNDKYSKRAIDFLARFPADEEFEDATDFITRCDELELFLREERNQPVEKIMFPEGG